MNAEQLPVRSGDLGTPTEAQLRELLATVDLGAFMARDMDGTIRHWSAGCERLYGWSAAEAVGKISHDLLMTRFPVPVADVEAELRLNGFWEGELEHRARDGRELIVSARKMLRRDARDREHILELVTNVTAQRQAETTLAAILDALPVGVIIVDENGSIVRDNPANRAIWGQPPEKGRWKEPAEWIGFWPETGERVLANEWAMSRALLKGEIVRDEIVECQPFGTAERRAVLNSAAPIRNAAGRIVGAVVAQLNVTERRTAELKLAESESKLRTIIDTVPVGLVLAEFPSGRIVSGNNFVEIMLRHPVLPSSDINSYDEWVAFHADGSRVRGTEYPLARMTTAGEENPSIEVNYQRGDGTLAWTRITGRPVRDASGNLVGGVVALLDIDGERRARTALEEVNRHLEDRVLQEVAAREVAQKSARTAQHMQAVGHLAGGVAHEFNNILQAVQGSASLIDSRAHLPDVVQKFARLILTASERGGTITSRLLSFAQRAMFDKERIDPAAILANVAEVLGRTLGANIEVRVEHASGLPDIVVDKVQLETALVNLATNARDAMLQGGILKMTADAVNITDKQTSGLTPGYYLRLSVRDSGTGMDEDVLAQATTPFFTTKPPGSGTGLGLSMAKGFAEQSGGSISIDSQPGQGTTVVLWLPAAETFSQAAVLPTDTAQMRSRKNHTVLLVDDEAMIREVLKLALDDAGLTVTAVSSGEEALDLLRSGASFDIMIRDFSMPGMDGVALIREAHQTRPALPVALLTGYAPTDERLLAAGLPPGAFPVLSKPVRPEQIICTVEGLLATGQGALTGQH